MQHVTRLLRSLVSGSRHRVVDEELQTDLDLTYITPRIIATSYPAQGVEAVYRNSLAELALFLNARHPESYLVLNLSERPYPPAALNNSVLDAGFPDHHSPPVEVAWRCCLTMHSWLRAAAANVVVVHCLAGKGRTGVVIACYLLFSGALFEREGGGGAGEGEGGAAATFTLPSPRALANRALGSFAKARGEGVKYASQKRMVRYFAQVIHATILLEHARLTAAAASAAAAAAAGSGAAAPAAAPLAQLPAWDAGAPDGAGGEGSEAHATQCLWAAAESVRSLRSIPLPSSTPLRLLSCAIGGVPGLVEAAHLFGLVVASAPYQGATRRVFYDSRSVALPDAAKEVQKRAYSVESGGVGGAAAGGGGGSSTSTSASGGAAAADHPASHIALVFTPRHAQLKGDILLNFCFLGSLDAQSTYGPLEVFRTALHSECGGGGQCMRAPASARPLC